MDFEKLKELIQSSDEVEMIVVISEKDKETNRNPQVVELINSVQFKQFLENGTKYEINETKLQLSKSFLKNKKIKGKFSSIVDLLSCSELDKLKFAIHYLRKLSELQIAITGILTYELSTRAL